jgi:hypothetical protein
MHVLDDLLLLHGHPFSYRRRLVTSADVPKLHLIFGLVGWSISCLLDRSPAPRELQCARDAVYLSPILISCLTTCS